MSECVLLTSHGLVMLCVARNPGTTLREIAQCVGITERAVQRIVCDLSDAGYLSRRRVGRQNTYEIHPDAELKHSLLAGCKLGDLLAALDDSSGRRERAAA